jgi:hypothetical protein
MFLSWNSSPVPNPDEIESLLLFREKLRLASVNIVAKPLKRSMSIHCHISAHVVECAPI